MARIRQALDEGNFESFRRTYSGCWTVPPKSEEILEKHLQTVQKSDILVRTHFYIIFLEGINQLWKV